MRSKSITITDYDGLDAQLLELGRRKVSISKAEAEMNQQIQIVRDGFDARTATDRAESELIEKKIERFCLVHKSEFKKVRTKTMVHGDFGFRTNPPKVSQLNRKYNTNTTLKLVKRLFKGLYIRTKEEIDKDAILADYASRELDDPQLAAVGLKIDQCETFFVEPNWETIANE